MQEAFKCISVVYLMFLDPPCLPHVKTLIELTLFYKSPSYRNLYQILLDNLTQPSKAILVKTQYYSKIFKFESSKFKREL